MDGSRERDRGREKEESDVILKGCAVVPWVDDRTEREGGGGGRGLGRGK